MKTLKVILGVLLLISLMSGCSVKPVETPVENTVAASDKGEQKPVKEDFIIGFHPFKDDPDNPSPHNPLVRKFGDIPEVRTYIRYKQKLEYGPGLNINEAVELYRAEYHLYRTSEAKRSLKAMESDRRRYERLGLSMDEIIMSYRRNTASSGETSTGDEGAD